MTGKVRALLLPWLIVGALTGAAIGAAASNLVSGTHITHEEATATTPTEGEGDVPELVIIPELVVVESGNADECYADAP